MPFHKYVLQRFTFLFHTPDFLLLFMRLPIYKLNHVIHEDVANPNHRLGYGEDAMQRTRWTSHGSLVRAVIKLMGRRRLQWMRSLPAGKQPWIRDALKRGLLQTTVSYSGRRTKSSTGGWKYHRWCLTLFRLAG